MQQGSRQPPPPGSQGLGYLLVATIEALGRSIALTVEVFLHHSFGVRYVDCGFLGVVVLFFFAGFFPGQNPLPLYGYMVVYGLLWLIAGIGALRRRWSGKNIMHSKYTGHPYLWRLLPSWKEENVKQVEVLPVILLGYGVHHLNRPLGDYLMMAATLVFFRGYNLALQRRERVMEMNDHAIEQRLIAERFREIQGQ
jgi:hypothetical protein